MGELRTLAHLCGMATVYLAHDLKHDRKVALKVPNPELAAVLGADCSGDMYNGVPMAVPVSAGARRQQR